MANEEHREPNGHLRTTRSGPDGLTHVKPQRVTEVNNPCPTCHNTTHLQEDWRPEPGYDRRMRKYKCMQGHHHYTVPKHSRPIGRSTLDPRRTL